MKVKCEKNGVMNLKVIMRGEHYLCTCYSDIPYCINTRHPSQELHFTLTTLLSQNKLLTALTAVPTLKRNPGDTPLGDLSVRKKHMQNNRREHAFQNIKTKCGTHYCTGLIKTALKYLS